MGQLLYSGKWTVEPNIELDYVINYTMERCGAQIGTPAAAP